LKLDVKCYILILSKIANIAFKKFEMFLIVVFISVVLLLEFIFFFNGGLVMKMVERIETRGGGWLVQLIYGTEGAA
jgi:hypothetical protein